MNIRVLLAFIAASAAAPASGAELRVYPSEFAVSGPNRVQQLLVVNEENGRTVADFTATAKYTTSNVAVAKVDASGLVTAVAPGEATITATWQAKPVSVKVTVAAGNADWNFRNHVIPTLTRTGCNSGSCHGALAGKGGLKLSLRGYDPESDYFVLTRQALGRRVDLSRPGESLMLKKATRTLPHGGGTRFEEGSDHHAMLLKWIEAGAPGPKDAD